MLLLFYGDMGVCLIEEGNQGVCHNGGNRHTDEARHHERVVEQVLAYDGGARTVEVHGGDVRWVVRDEEVAIYAWEHTQQHGASDA